MKRVYAVVIFAVIVSLTSFLLDRYAKNLMAETSYVLSILQNIETYEHKVSSEILKSAHFFYYSYDGIYDTLDKEEVLIEELSSRLSDGTPDILMLIEAIKEDFKLKRLRVEDFETLNSSLKNSFTYVSSLSLDYLSLSDSIDTNYLKILQATESYLILSKKSFDISFLRKVEGLIRELKEKRFSDEKLSRLNSLLIKHLTTLSKVFPQYLETFMYITTYNPIPNKLEKLRKLFLKEREEKGKVITFASVGFSSLFIGVMFYVIYLLTKLERHRKELSQLNSELRRAITTDELTKLPNRMAFYSFLEGRSKGCLILVNLDGFKRINDVYGSEIGDRLLKGVGKFIKRWTKGKNLKADIFRLGADDFGLFLGRTSKKDAFSIATQLLKDMENHTFTIDGLSISVNASAGISCESPFLEKADIAVKNVKRGREKVAFYSTDMEETFRKNLAMALTLKRALREDGIRLHYQRVVDTENGELLYYECLIRIDLGDKKLLGPRDFLSIAKETRYYRQITKRVLHQAFESFKDKGCLFSVNISADDITDGHMENFLFKLLESDRETTKRLVLEILESESIENYEKIRDFFRRVRSLGVKVAIDDFGSGYSNFSHVAQLRPDFIKIDGSLIEGLRRSPANRAIVSTIAEFCRKLNIPAIAEFVSREEIYREVKELKIPYVQGFYISKPTEDIEC